MTSDAESALGREADILPPLAGRAREACSHGSRADHVDDDAIGAGRRAGDRTLLEERGGFTALDFSVFHPGGKLGAKLMLVRDVMHMGDRIPRVSAHAKCRRRSSKYPPRASAASASSTARTALVGIITDGDLRRHMKSDLMDTPVAEVMTRSPRTIAADALVAEALELISRKISALLVVDDDQSVVGIVHFHTTCFALGAGLSAAPSTTPGEPRLFVRPDRNLFAPPRVFSPASPGDLDMYLSNESLLVVLVVGLVAGWLAGQVMRGYGFGLVGDLLVGLIGASSSATTSCCLLWNSPRRRNPGVDHSNT